MLRALLSAIRPSDSFRDFHTAQTEPKPPPPHVFPRPNLPALGSRLDVLRAVTRLDGGGHGLAAGQDGVHQQHVALRDVEGQLLVEHVQPPPGRSTSGVLSFFCFRRPCWVQEGGRSFDEPLQRQKKIPSPDLRGRHPEKKALRGG